MQVHLSPWDFALVAVVSIQTTLIAYLHSPRAKAFVLSLPVPFTLVAMSLGRRVEASNVIGLVLLYFYFLAVQLLQQSGRVPIVPAIGLALAGYGAAAWGMARVLPETEAVFWVSCGATLLAGVTLLLRTAHRQEPGHRTPLPLWQKLPIIVAVVCVLVLIKQSLKGFATAFPLVSVVGAYEARHCLRTMTRQIPALAVAMIPLLAAAHVAHARLGLGWSMGIGWILFFAVLIPMTLPRVEAEERD